MLNVGAEMVSDESGSRERLLASQSLRSHVVFLKAFRLRKKKHHEHHEYNRFDEVETRNLPVSDCFAVEEDVFTFTLAIC